MISAAAIFLVSGMSVSANSLKDCFDAKYYSSTYPDLKEAFGDDVQALYKHYTDYGISEGRDINKYFNVKVYRDKYPDLDAAFGNNWDAYYEHYLNYGLKEMRIATENTYAFDAIAYANKYPDLQKAFGDDVQALFQHYITFGIDEGRTFVIEGVETESVASDQTNPTVSPNISSSVIPSEDMSEAEKQFFGAWYDGHWYDGSTFITSPESMPYEMTCNGEGWGVWVRVFYDKNNKPKYVSINRGITDDYEYFERTTYDVYIKWLEGYKKWILENNPDYNSYFMADFIYPSVVYTDGSEGSIFIHTDGTTEAVDKVGHDNVTWGWRFEDM